MAFSPFSLGASPNMQTQQVKRPQTGMPADATDLADYLQTYGGSNTTNWSSIQPELDKLGVGDKSVAGSPGWEFQDYGLGSGGTIGLGSEARNKLAGYKIGRDAQSTGKDARDRLIYDPQGNVLGKSAEDTSTSNLDRFTDLGAKGLFTYASLGAAGAFGGGAFGGAAEGAGTFGAPFGGGLGGAGAGLGELTGGLGGLDAGLSAGEFGAGFGALEGGALGGGALGLDGASYALPGAEGEFGLVNAGTASGEGGAGAYTTAAADSQAANAAMASGEITSPALTTGASIPSAIDLGSAGGLMQTAAGAGAAGGALGLEGATYALPGAEAEIGLANVGAAAETGAPAYTTAAADSQLANAAMASGEIASPTLTGAASVPSAINFGGAGGLMQTAGGAAGAAGGLGSMLSSAGSGISNFINENPAVSSTLKGAGAALGAGLAQKALAGNPPTTPSASELSGTQAQANLTAAQQQAQLNRVDTTTPFGFQKFGQVADPSVPGGVRYTQDIGFSPQQQALYNSETSNQLASQKTAQGMQGRVADAVANPFSLSSTPAAEAAMKGDAFSSDRDAVTKSLFGRLTRLRGPQMAQETEALDTKLRNQGLMPGTVAYDNGMRSLKQAQETELSDQADRAIQAGGAEQTRLQTDARANAGFNNQNRSQNIQEQLLQRQQPLAEYNAFRTGNTPTLPTFQPFGMSSVAPTNTVGAANTQYQSQADAYNAQIAKLQSLLNFGTTVAKGG